MKTKYMIPWPFTAMLFFFFVYESEYDTMCIKLKMTEDRVCAILDVGELKEGIVI